MSNGCICCTLREELLVCAAMHWGWLGDLLRSKGWFWLATRHDLAGSWSQAGGLVRHGAAGSWWDAAAAEDWPEDPTQRVRIEAAFEGPYGDRRQELVFIGQHLDVSAMRARLDACLLNDAELALGPAGWRALHDPFPNWLKDADAA